MIKTIKDKIDDENYGKIILETKYGLQDEFKNQLPYFSLTCSGKTPYGYFIFGGADHDTILKVHPEMKDIADLHLSNINGEPSYAVENGWYFLTNKELHNNLTEEDRPRLVAEHLRISKKEANGLIKKYKEGKFKKEDFEKYVDAQRPRWKEEADKVIAKYDLKVRKIVNLTPDDKQEKKSELKR